MLRSRRSFFLLLLLPAFLPPVCSRASLRAVPRTAGLVVRFGNVTAARSLLKEILSWQLGKKRAGGSFSNWDSYLTRGTGAALLSAKGLSSLGIDPSRPVTLAYLEKEASFCIVANIVKKGIVRPLLENVLGHISGWKGTVRSERIGGIPVRLFGPRRATWALRYYVSGGMLVVCNSAAAVIATYNASRWPGWNIRALGDTLFSGAGVDIITTPAGLMGFFRHQLPYEDFIQENPLDGFFRRVILGFYPKTGELRIRLARPYRPNQYIRYFSYLFSPSLDRKAERGIFKLPFYSAFRVRPVPFFRWALGRLPESWQTRFYLATIRIGRQYGLSILGELVNNWTGEIALSLFPQGKGVVPSFALRFRGAFPAAKIIRFLKKTGVVRSTDIKGGITRVLFTRPVPVFGKECHFSVEKRRLLVAASKKHHREFRRVLERMKTGGEAFRLVFHPGELIRLWGKRKDFRSYFFSFLQGLSQNSLFTVEGSHFGPYIYIHTRRRED